VNVVAAIAVVAAFGGAAALGTRAARRTNLGVWHPALAWLGLEAVFFGIGSAALAMEDGRLGPAWDVAASVMAFGLAVAASDAIGRRRSDVTTIRASTERPDLAASDEPGIRWPVVAGMIGVGVVALLPTLLIVGLPALTPDITAARSAIGGLELQPLRVAIPAGLAAAVVVAVRNGSPGLRAVTLAAMVIALGVELALASRYLAAELAAAVVIALGLAGRRLPARALALAAGGGLALFLTIGVLRAAGDTNGRPVEFAVERSISRVFLIQPRTLDALQTAIPAEVPYFGGLTWIRRLAPLIGRDDVPNLGYWIYPRLFPDQPTPGYAAPGILGEAWANFGPFGVAVAAGLGILAERLGAWIAARRTAVADIAAGAVASLFLARTHAVGLTGLIVLVVLVVAWRLLAAPAANVRSELARNVSWRA